MLDAIDKSLQPMTLSHSAPGTRVDGKEVDRPCLAQIQWVCACKHT